MQNSQRPLRLLGFEVLGRYVTDFWVQAKVSGLIDRVLGPYGLIIKVLGCSGRGSKQKISKVSGPKKPLRIWFLGPESENIGYLDALGT